MSENISHNEKDLLLQVSEGDEKAFRMLFDKYRNKIYSLGIHLTRSEVLSEEIVQEVFLKVWEKKEQLQEINFFNSWLRTVARNICSNYLRNLAIERLALDQFASASKENPSSPENNVANKEYEQILQDAIGELPPQQKKVYLLSRRDGKKQEEIARELGISIYTVKEYMKLAVRSIRHSLEKRIDLVILLAIALYLD